jgi:hypothetical protein
VQRRHNLVRAATATIYRNYPGATAGGTPQSVTIDSFLDVGATTLTGPYAHTFTDADDVVHGPGDTPPPAGEVGSSGGGDWDYPLTNIGPCLPLCVWDPLVASSWTANREADATQTHWFVSNFHDHLKNAPGIDFTTAAGNFEGSDPVIAQNMDGANTASGLPDSHHINNANMSTPADNTSPTMQMYLTDAGPSPASSGLDLRSEPTDCPVASRDPVCGGGASGHAGGYSYADFGKVSGSPEGHADGEIWTQTLWQLRQALIAKRGVTDGTDSSGAS